jgi:hypothetical protein
MGFKYYALLAFCPRIFVDRRIEMIVPSKSLKKQPLTTLLARPTLQPVGLHHFVGDDGPAFIAEPSHQLYNGSVFLRLAVTITYYSHARRSPIYAEHKYVVIIFNYRFRLVVGFQGRR